MNNKWYCNLTLIYQADEDVFGSLNIDDEIGNLLNEAGLGDIFEGLEGLNENDNRTFDSNETKSFIDDIHNKFLKGKFLYHIRM